MTHATLPAARLPWNRLVRGLVLALAAAALVVAYVLVMRPAPIAAATQASADGVCEWARDLPDTWLPGIGAEPACR